MSLLDRIAAKTAHVGVIGLGYVGLPLVVEFVKAGFQVTGFDIDDHKVTLLRQGLSYIKHIDISPLMDHTDQCSRSIIQDSGPNHAPFADRQEMPINTIEITPFKATSDFSLLEKMDCILICVPTPLNKNREPDMSYVFNTARIISKYLKQGQLIVLESTTYPGTTDEDVRNILEESGLKAGADFHLAFSPEREDPANSLFSLGKVPKIVGGLTEGCLKTAQSLYDMIVVRTVPVSSPRVAEAAKLLENIYRAVNIALVNELKMLFDRMNIDIWEVIEAAKTKPFGFQPFYPGPGLGGHCIPIDPFYLTWKAREYEFPTRFIELAGEINTSMPDYVVGKVMEALNRAGKPLRDARILMLGLAYKANVDDDRESPSYYLMEKLESRGALVDYNDPYIAEIPMTRKFSRFAGKRSVDIKEFSDIQGLYDMILIATAHDEYKGLDPTYLSIPIVDTRGMVKNGSNVYRA